GGGQTVMSKATKLVNHPFLYFVDAYKNSKKKSEEKRINQLEPRTNGAAAPLTLESSVKTAVVKSDAMATNGKPTSSLPVSKSPAPRPQSYYLEPILAVKRSI